MDRFLSDRKALRFPLFPGMGRSRQGAADTSGSSSTATAHPAESKLLSSHTTLQILASCVTWGRSMWAPGASSGGQKGKVINEPLLISTIYLFSLTSWTDKPDIKNGTCWHVLLLCFAWREDFPCTLGVFACFSAPIWVPCHWKYSPQWWWGGSVLSHCLPWLWVSRRGFPFPHGIRLLWMISAHTD